MNSGKMFKKRYTPSHLKNFDYCHFNMNNRKSDFNTSLVVTFSAIYKYIVVVVVHSDL